MGNSFIYILLGFRHGIDETHAIGQIRGNGARQGTARAVGARTFYAFPLEIVELLTVKQNIRRIFHAVSSLDQDGFGAHGTDGFSRFFHIRQIFYRLSRQHFCFRNIGREDIGQRQQDFFQGLFGFGNEEPVAAGSYHDRVDDDEARLILPEFGRNDADCFRNTYHADLYGIDVDIFENGINLICNEIRRHIHIATHALCILRNDGRNDIEGKTAVGTKGLAICRRAGTARRIRTGN